MELQDWVKQRASDMAKRPRMFAITKEAYCMAFSMLGEIAQLPKEQSHEEMLDYYKPMQYGSAIKGQAEPVDDEFAEVISETFYRQHPHLRMP